MEEIQKILFPCDLTKNAERIVPFLRLMVRKFEAEVLVLHVVEDFTRWEGFYIPHLSLKELQSQARSGAARALDAFCIDYLSEFPRASCKMVTGDPATEILRSIEEDGVDAVVMGTHGLKGLERTVFGSVAEKVVKKSPVPVFTFNPYLMRGKGREESAPAAA